MAGFFIVPTEGPELGFKPESLWVHKVRSRIGSTQLKGSVAVLDFQASATEVATNTNASYIPNTGESVWKTIVDPATTNIRQTWHCVLEEDIADNALGRVSVYGLTTAYCVGASTITPGSFLRPTSTNSFAVATTNQRYSAIYLAPSARPTTRALKTVMLFGCVMGGMVTRS